MEKLRPFFRTAYGVMAVVLIQYVAKVALKGGFGAAMHSPVFTGDAWHGASDIFQALLVVFGIWLSRRPPNRDYPLGWRGLDTLGSLLIGVSLAYAALVGVLVPSALGLASLAGGVAGAGVADAHRSLLLEGRNGVIAVGIMLVSAGVSAVVGRFQILVGRETGHASVEADGEETLSDGKVEALAAAGLAAYAIFRAPWIEHALGLGMAYIMFGTAREILANARDMVLNRSLGMKTEDAIRASALATSGVEEIGSLVTYRRGTCSVVEADVVTRLGPSGAGMVREVLTRRIRDLLTEGDREAHVSVRCVEPPAREFRRAYLTRIGDDGIPRVVGAIELATHLTVCDESDDGRAPKRHDVSVTPATLRQVLVTKNVRVLCVYVTPGGTLDDLRALVDGRVPVESVPTSIPTLLNIPLV